MWQLFQDVIKSPFGSFGFVCGILYAVGYGIFRITKFSTEISVENKTFENRVGKIESNTDTILRDIAYIKGNMDIMRMPNTPNLMQAHSPISLTEDGLKISQELKANDIVERNWTQIYKNIEVSVKDKNSYDIQEYCLETASVEPELFFDTSDINFIKDFAFKKGHPFQLYSKLIGIVIRDKYFKTKNIPLGDIDNHDPKRNV